MDTNNKRIPNQVGQICELVYTPNAKPQQDVYILIDDPSNVKNEDLVTVVSLNNLQRNVNNPDLAPRHSFKKTQLNVLAENLESYVNSWNRRILEKNYQIDSIEKVKKFFNDLHSIYDSEFHPDDDFNDYTDKSGQRSFTYEEADYLNEVMTRCFQFCDNNNLDIYDLAGEVQIEIWKKQGLWPS